jgi:hypothetical protein
MSESEMISRRKAFSLLGLAAAFGLAAAPTVLTVLDAEAQQPAPATGQQAAPSAGGTTGMKRRQARRTGRHERRHERRKGRKERREERHKGREERREERKQ